MSLKKDYDKIEAFSNQVKSLKTRLEYSHKQMAELFGVPRYTYMHWYNGRTMPYEPRYSHVMGIIGEEML